MINVRFHVEPFDDVIILTEKTVCSLCQNETWIMMGTEFKCGCKVKDVKLLEAGKLDKPDNL